MRRCSRALIEPLEEDEAEALAGAAEIEATLLADAIGLEQVHHGDGIASWRSTVARSRSATASAPASTPPRSSRRQRRVGHR